MNVSNIGTKVKERFNNLKESAKRTGVKVVIWAKENPELAITVASIAAGAIGTVTKAAHKRAAVKSQQELKDRYIYDRRAGHYWPLKRDLTSSEWAYVDERQRNGEPLSDILMSMRVLK